MAERIYTVRKGDTVMSICLTHRLSHEDFVKLNPQFGVLGFRSIDRLVPGEVLVVGVDYEDPVELINAVRRRHGRPKPKAEG